MVPARNLSVSDQYSFMPNIDTNNSSFSILLGCLQSNVEIKVRRNKIEFYFYTRHV